MVPKAMASLRSQRNIHLYLSFSKVLDSLLTPRTLGEAVHRFETKAHFFRHALAFAKTAFLFFWVPHEQVHSAHLQRPRPDLVGYIPWHMSEY
jgi:hypothetical protein